ncbi:MAG TPA: YHS domain-containing protein [Acidobacteriota bacterium]|nr:YHS domain-containing protein [Acidobacteriota bacterium]
MRKTMTLATIIAVTLFTAVGINAQADTTETTLKNQSRCPVMGGAIDSTVFTDIQGQRVYHCCPGCSKALKADPDKYFKKAAAEGIMFENIQATCPVTGEILQNKKVQAHHEGRHLYFCSEQCVDKFQKDPGQYLGSMDRPADNKNEGHGKHRTGTSD